MITQQRRWHRRLATRLFFCAALLAAANSFSPAARAETLKVGGTGAALGTLKLLGAEFTRQHPGIEVNVLSYIGSTGAIKGVAAGDLDLGLSGRALKPAEEKLDLLFSAYARTPLIIATHRDYPLKSISRQQLAAIYSGQQTQRDDGGTIRIVLRPAYETDNDVLRTISPELSGALDSALARPGMRYAATDQEAADAFEKVPGAIGTSTLALALSEKRQIGVLALDGVAPSVDALQKGSYPYYKSLFLVSRRNASPAVQALIAFIRSPAGRSLLLANGQLPIQP
ncbi:MAG TPA: substrate-binding domain-containing protein [Rhodocyclaceae bacterium]|nr:substrate-binding domain-containing protein [Rhodocyclaceae bacterium]